MQEFQRVCFNMPSVDARGMMAHGTCHASSLEQCQDTNNIATINLSGSTYDANFPASFLFLRS